LRLERLDGCNLKGVQAILLANRHIVAEHKPVGAEVIAGFVFLVTADIIAKCETASLFAHEVADVIFFIRAEPVLTLKFQAAEVVRKRPSK
jgi:hypothetical protein